MSAKFPRGGSRTFFSSKSNIDQHLKTELDITTSLSNSRKDVKQLVYIQILLLSRQPRVTVTSCFVYKVIREL